jgi:hypothetical protein
LSQCRTNAQQDNAHRRSHEALPTETSHLDRLLIVQLGRQGRPITQAVALLVGLFLTPNNMMMQVMFYCDSHFLQPFG